MTWLSQWKVGRKSVLPALLHKPCLLQGPACVASAGWFSRLPQAELLPSSGGTEDTHAFLNCRYLATIPAPLSMPRSRAQSMSTMLGFRPAWEEPPEVCSRKSSGWVPQRSEQSLCAHSPCSLPASAHAGPRPRSPHQHLPGPSRPLPALAGAAATLDPSPLHQPALCLPTQFHAFYDSTMILSPHLWML